MTFIWPLTAWFNIRCKNKTFAKSQIPHGVYIERLHMTSDEKFSATTSDSWTNSRSARLKVGKFKHQTSSMIHLIANIIKFHSHSRSNIGAIHWRDFIVISLLHIGSSCCQGNTIELWQWIISSYMFPTYSRKVLPISSLQLLAIAWRLAGVRVALQLLSHCLVAS